MCLRVCVAMGGVGPFRFPGVSVSLGTSVPPVAVAAAASAKGPTAVHAQWQAQRLFHPRVFVEGIY